MLPIVLHIPHSSKAIPSEIRYQFLLSDDELSNELNRMTDAFTDDLFSTKISIIKHTIVYPVSRLVVDPERFIDDDKEVMSKKGNCVKLFQQMGYSIKMNSPFSGSIAPKNYYQQNRNVFSIMIEINRRLYMNEKTGMKNERYEALKSNISKAIKSIKDFK